MAHDEDKTPSVGYCSSGTVTPIESPRTKPVPPSAVGMQAMPAVEAAILSIAKVRADRPVDQTFFRAVMAGIWVGFGGIAGMSAASGMPNSVRADWPIVPKFLTGAFFAFALHFIIFMGAELVTGTTLIFSIGWCNRAISPRRSIINLVVIYIGNWCGCLIMAYFMAYLGDLFDDPSSKQWMNSLVLGKVGHGWGVLFLRAIGANAMVCIAITMFNACTDSAGKVMVLWIPVVTFVISGFEHCVANMFFLSTGLMYGAPSTIGKLWFNQSAAICGNFIGGAVVVGLSMHLMNSWNSPIPWPEAPSSLPSKRVDEERSPLNFDLYDFFGVTRVIFKLTLMFTQPSLLLPTVSTKHDAHANQNDTSGSKLSVADSLVLLQSLKQSRSIWLTKAFLRFSTRSKDKADQVNPAPPPHSLSLAGSCDLEIGPHLFPQTKIFFVQYRYGQPPAQAATSTPAQPPTAAPPPTAAAASERPAPITVSHELHAKVLAAASKDADLNLILQLASQGRADVTQLRTLGTAIKAIDAGTYLGPGTSAVSTSHAPAAPAATLSQAQSTPGSAQPAPVAPPRPVSTSVAPSPSTPAPSSTPWVASTPVVAPFKSTSLPTPAPATTPRPTPSAHVSTPTRKMAPPAIPTTAVLLEFAERPIDRWLLPTEYVLIDRRSNGDIHLSTFYPFDAYVPAGGTARSKPAHPLTMRFAGASSEIWDALSKTCTTVASSDVQAILAEIITNVPSRTYLQYRIAPGALWEDIKTANPHAQSFLLPSKTPIPSATTTRQRRTDSTTGGSAPKKRKTDQGDSTTSKPKAKGKEKEKKKEADLTPLAAPTPVPTNQPATQPTVPSDLPPAPANQIPAPIIPNTAGSTSNAVTVPTSTSIPPVPKPTLTTSATLIDTLNNTTSCMPPGKIHSASIIQTAQSGGPTATLNNPTRSLYPPHHSALSQAASSYQPQPSPPSQQAERPPDQNASVDPPVTGEKS